MQVTLIDMTRFLFTILSVLLIPEEEMRFTHTYKQGFDTSCGIAVTATVLNSFWNMPIEERDMYQEMILDRYSGEETSYTINFLTIADHLTQYGIHSRAYNMNWAELEDALNKEFAPVIIHYNKPRQHFALLVHISGDYAFVADPAKGFELVERNRFENNYSGRAMLTASVEANKNIERIEQIKRDETIRLERLQNLSRIRGRW